MNGLSAQVHLTVNSVGHQTHLVVISSVLEFLIRTDILSNWQNSHIGSRLVG